MRIISGKFRGKRIAAPKTLPTRPTTDLAKESLFNILNNYYYFEDIVVLDLFTGIGSISYEFASRGVPEIVAVDHHFPCIKFVNDTAHKLPTDAITTVKSDVFAFLQSCHQKFHVIFADPPYDMEDIDRIPQLVFTKNLLKKGGVLIIEHGPRTDLTDLQHFAFSRKYGHSTFSIFDPEQSGESED